MTAPTFAAPAGSRSSVRTRSSNRTAAGRASPIPSSARTCGSSTITVTACIASKYVVNDATHISGTSSTTGPAQKGRDIASTHVRSIFSVRRNPSVERNAGRRASAESRYRRERSLRRLARHPDGRADKGRAARCKTSTFKVRAAEAKRWPISSPSGIRTPDVFISVDPKLVAKLGDRVASSITFAGTSLGIAWAPSSRYASLFQGVVAGKTSLAERAADAGLEHRPHRSDSSTRKASTRSKA